MRVPKPRAEGPKGSRPVTGVTAAKETRRIEDLEARAPDTTRADVRYEGAREKRRPGGAAGAQLLVSSVRKKSESKSERPVAVVTGAGRGMGLETCRQLAERGFAVVLTTRSARKARASVNTLRREGLDVVHHTLDVTRPKSARDLAEFVRRRFGRVDVLVNNAGVFLESLVEINKPGAPTLLDVPPNVLSKTLDANASGPLNVARAFLPLLRESGGGRIINITSVLSLLEKVGPGAPAYRMSKATLNAMTCILAKELEPEGITVNAVDPGWVKTDMGGDRAPKTVQEGVDTAVWLATAPAEALETGKLYRDHAEVDWWNGLERAPSIGHVAETASTPLDGASVRRVFSPTADPEVAIDHVALDSSRAVRLSSDAHDARLVVASGRTAVALGPAVTEVEPRDVVLAPRGTKLALTSLDGGEVWRISSPRSDAPGGVDQPHLPKMLGQAAVLHYDPANDFVHQEGCIINPVASSAEDNSTSLAFARVGPGKTTALHVLDVDERYLVIDGHGEVELAGKRFPVKPGSVVSIPRGTPQRITNSGASDLTFWCVCTPRYTDDCYTHLEDTGST